MKLEIEYPAAAAPYSNSSIKFQFIAADDADVDAAEILEAGIRYAKEDKREQARHLLFRAAALEPENETAWLWLASLSEYPEELLVFLQNVLNVNPSNERAIEWQKATKSMLADTFVERGIAAAQENRRDYANQCFMQALLHDGNNETAWLRMAANSDEPEEKAAHLEKVLSINPKNETALASLKSLKHQISQALMKKANFAAISGERDEARCLLAEAMQDAPELEDAWILKAYLADADEEKIACYEKILELNPENETAQAGLGSLRALMQKAAAKKSNAETLLEVFANSNGNYHGDLSLAEPQVQILAEAREQAPAMELSAVIDEPILEEASAPEVEAVAEDFSQDFAIVIEADQYPAVPPSPAKPFDSPTDDLDVRYVEVIRSQGAFAGEPPLDWENFQQNLKTAEEEAAAKFLEQLEVEPQTENALPPVTYVEPEEPAMEIPNMEIPDVDDLPLSDFQLPPVEAVEKSIPSLEIQSEEPDYDPAPAAAQFEDDAPAPDFSKTSEIPQTYETTHLDQSFLTQANASSENFVSRWETFSQAASLDEDQQPIAETAPTAVEPQPESAELAPDPDAHKTPLQTEIAACPFCFVTNDPQAFICSSCHAILSLSDMEMILAHGGANPEVVGMAIEDLEGEKASRALSETELTNLGIAHLNAKNLRQGLSCLQEASQLAPNNILLASKVNFLAIRLAELEAQESRHEAEPQLRNLTIMVVDDSPTVRKLISGKLEKCGHTVVALENGSEALEKIKEVVPDLILLDIMMPQMDGYQVCKLIRNYDPTKNVPVVMISGKDGFFDKARARMAGTSGYITKPFGPDTLMKTIETYVA